MNQLENLLEMKKLSFYKGSNNDQDKKDKQSYYDLQETLKNQAKLLKRGDKVLFNFPKKIKDKSSRLGFTFIDELYKGTVIKPLYNKVRKGFEEDSLIPTIKCESGKYTFEVSPDDICKI